MALYSLWSTHVERLSPVTGFLPEETCFPHVLEGLNCFLADACRNVKSSDSLRQGLAPRSIGRRNLLRKQTLG